MIDGLGLMLLMSSSQCQMGNFVAVQLDTKSSISGSGLLWCNWYRMFIEWMHRTDKEHQSHVYSHTGRLGYGLLYFEKKIAFMEQIKEL